MHIANTLMNKEDGEEWEHWNLEPGLWWATYLKHDDKTD